MTRARAIELLEQLSRANAGAAPLLEGRELLEAMYALAYSITILRELTTDETFAYVVADLAPWLT